MKRLILMAIITLLIGSVASAQITYVMSMGVSKYADSNNNLTQTTKDAKAFRDIMRNKTDKITILTSSHANRDNILKKLNSISKLAKENDKIILFYSGHG